LPSKGIYLSLIKRKQCSFTPPQSPHSLHVAPEVQRADTGNGARATCEHMACEPGFITSFISFQAKAASFSCSYFSAEVISISPHTWWQGSAVCGIDPAFADLAD